MKRGSRFRVCIGIKKTGIKNVCFYKLKAPNFLRRSSNLPSNSNLIVASLCRLSCSMVLSMCLFRRCASAELLLLLSQAPIFSVHLDLSVLSKDVPLGEDVVFEEEFGGWVREGSMVMEVIHKVPRKNLQ